MFYSGRSTHHLALDWNKYEKICISFKSAYVQTPLLVILTDGFPVALMTVTRSCRPTVGLERQVVNVAWVAPIPVG